MSNARGAYDFVVVGSGPNGLVAGINLAKAGARVLLLEGAATPGGGCRSGALTLPGFVHDLCAAVHPMAVLSPAFNAIGLEQLGVEYRWSEVPLAHPLPGGEAAILFPSLERTAQSLGGDARPWLELMQPFLDRRFLASILRPVWFGMDAWWTKARFGLLGLRSCEALVQHRFRGEAARALFAGCAAHSTLPLDRAGTASFGLVLALAGQVVGWPCIYKGSQGIVDALLRVFVRQGGVFEPGHQVQALATLPECRAVLFDLNPHQMAAICGDALPRRYRARLQRFRRGPGIFKIDWALDGPIPWQNPACLRAATVHVGGTWPEIAQAEAAVAAGHIPEKPFVLLAQPSVCDDTRSPAGKQVGWAYCHVPNGCDADMAMAIETQIERFAPGFRDRILARHTMHALQVENHNPAMTGGDIGGGANDLGQFLFRPVPRWNPYTTPNPKIFLCSSSTPPGGGVHGMCGYWAALTVLKQHWKH